jgi:hypothetical protein
MQLNQKTIKVNAISVKNKSFMESTPEGDKWYNFSPEECNLPGDIMNDLFKQVQKGDSVILTLGEKGWVDLKSAPQTAEVNRPQNKTFEGNKEIIPFETVLKKFQDKYKGKFSKDWELIHADYEKDIFVVKVIVTTSDGIVSDVGDSTPKNTKNAFIQPHYMRMALTRGFARCIKHIMGISECTDEETEDAGGKDI